MRASFSLDLALATNSNIPPAQNRTAKMIPVICIRVIQFIVATLSDD